MLFLLYVELVLSSDGIRRRTPTPAGTDDTVVLTGCDNDDTAAIEHVKTHYAMDVSGCDAMEAYCRPDVQLARHCPVTCGTCSHAICECKDTWQSEGYDIGTCNQSQSGCTNCDYDVKGPWCEVKVAGCIGHESGGDWMYCGATRDEVLTMLHFNPATEAQVTVLAAAIKTGIGSA